MSDLFKHMSELYELTGIHTLRESIVHMQNLTKALEDCRDLFFEINNTPQAKTYKLTRKGVEIIDKILGTG